MDYLAVVMDIRAHRIANQLIRGSSNTPAEVVAHMGAVQAQDYAGCKWAIGLRMQQATDALIEAAINDGSIIRTHVLRPTWHLVAPKDIRWMLELTAPRVNAFNSSQYRKLGLDEGIFKTCNRLLVKLLETNRYMTRADIAPHLQQKGIDTSDIRLTCIMMYAELAGLICNGPREGKQFTYALMDERIPAAPSLKRDEALAELTRRYFTSHAPATLQDFVWWSGLTVVDAKKGIESVKNDFITEVVNDISYYMPPSQQSPNAHENEAFLLPAFDEYTVAYKDRSTLLGPGGKEVTALGILSPAIVVDGIVAGNWRRTLKKDTAVVEIKPFTKLNKTDDKAIAAALARYGSFLGVKNIEHQ